MGTRGRPVSETCIRGHVIAEVGRRIASGTCAECDRTSRKRRGVNQTGDKYVKRLREDGPSIQYMHLPAEPLLRWLRARDVPTPRNSALEGVVIRAQRSGYFSVAKADEVCVNILRMHPAEVYGDLWWEAS